MPRFRIRTALLGVVLVALAGPATAADKPVKVFILAGQSNMEGHGFIKADPKRNEGKGSLEYVTKQPATADKFKHLLGTDGKWAVRDDVWIHYLDRKGKLTAGFGVKEDRIGPELGFGVVIGDAFEEPVLLIKLAWGGKSLAKDFRPPSSGGEVGPYYKEIVERTKRVLKDLKKEFPELGDRGYELAGFGWHQGWNDRVNQAFNDEYEKNMANFIRDVRKDLGVKDLPFVIAETGMSGPEEKHPRALALMKAQAAVAEHEEFKGNVAFVGTKAFWRDKEVSPTNQGYHWNTNAETYYLIGEAMGNAMKKLCEKKRAGEPSCVARKRSSDAELSVLLRGIPCADASLPAHAAAGRRPAPEGGDGRLPARSARQNGREVQRRVLDVRGGLAAAEELPRRPIPEWPVRHLDVRPVRRAEAGENVLRHRGRTRLVAGHPVRHRDAEVHHGRGGPELHRVGQRPRRRQGPRLEEPEGPATPWRRLSPWVLWPPDGLNLKQGTSGELFGYGYLPLPLMSPKKTTAGKDVPTGNQCWTLFLNTGNFKGPVAFFTPYFWSKPTVEKPELSGLFLDTRPSDPNRAIQMETQHIPAYLSKDAKGGTYARVAPTRFPGRQEGESPLIHRISAYSKAALWDGVDAWFNGGPAVSGKIDAGAASVSTFDGKGGATWQIYLPNTARDKKVPIAWNAFATPVALDDTTYGYKWARDAVTKDGSLVTLPEYYRLEKDNKDRERWVAVSPKDVPAETGLAKMDFPKRRAADRRPYVTPGEADSCWKKPGPAAGPFEAKLGDGSVATYYWYRFADQPALLNADLTADEREALQKRVELLHKNWTRDREYLPPPKVGKLADLDPAVLVTPPTGLEIGYVPIVTRQAAKE